MPVERYSLVHEGTQVRQINMVGKRTRQAIGSQLVDNDEKNVPCVLHAVIPDRSL